MAHAATSVSFRTVSLSISTMFWAALLIAAVSIAPRILPVAPPLEPDAITVVTYPPPVQPVKPEIVARTPAPTGDTFETPIAIAPAPTAEVFEPVSAGAIVLATPAPVIVRPTWVRRPTSNELGQYFPQRAITREKSGFVSLACIVRVDGNLACRVAEETPIGWGFGDAALRISQTYQMEPATRDGVPIEARYTLRVPFELH